MGWVVPAHHPGHVGPRLSFGDQASGDAARYDWGERGCSIWDKSLIPMTAPEVRRLLVRLIWTANPSAEFVLSWSAWRRRHQATARRRHYQRRLSLLSTLVRL